MSHYYLPHDLDEQGRELFDANGEPWIYHDQFMATVSRALLEDPADDADDAPAPKNARARLLLALARDDYQGWTNEDLAMVVADRMFTRLCDDEDGTIGPHERPLRPPPVKRLSPQPQTTAEWREENAYLLADPCVYCGEPATSLDHITARSNNGPNTWENAAPACQSCNSSKGRWPMLVWLARRGERSAR